MKKMLILATTLLCFTIAHSQNDSTEAIIRRLEQIGVNGILAGDTTSLTGIWAPEFIVTTPRNTIARSRAAVFSNMKAGLVNYKSFSREIEKVLIEPGVVITMGSETYVAAADLAESKAGETVVRRFTNVWMLKNSRWMQVARHASIVCK